MNQNRATIALKFMIMLHRLVNKKAIEDWVANEMMIRVWLDVAGITVEEMNASTVERSKTI